MEAKDRIIKLHDHLTVWLTGEQFEQVHKLFEKQDNISFKAGVEQGRWEVVEWLKRRNIYIEREALWII